MESIKKIIFLSCLFLCLTISFAQPVFYSGFINQKISINMRLEIQSVYEIKNDISYRSGYEFIGDYHFQKDKKKIRLEGKNNIVNPDKIHPDSIVRLNEYIQLENTGYFLGKFNKNGSYQGIWYSTDGITQYPFLLKVNQNASISFKREQSLLYPQLKGLKNRRVERNINTILTHLKAGVQIEEVAPGYFQRREYRFEILHNQKNIFSYSWNQALFEDSTYYGYLIYNSGGFSSFNLQTGKKISYEDILVKGSEEHIEKLLIEGINEFCEFELNTYKLEEIRNNLCVTETGLLFPYKACSSKGKYEQDWSIEIPFEEIKSYINPNGPLKNLYPATAFY
jgi:hypothetical protein